MKKKITKINEFFIDFAFLLFVYDKMYQLTSSHINKIYINNCYYYHYRYNIMFKLKHVFLAFV